MIKYIDKLLLHPKTRSQIKYLTQNPPHALLISSNVGGGKKTLARTIASELLGLTSDKSLESYPYFFHIKRLKNKNDISIEQIRAVINALKLKTPGTKSVRRAVFIENAHLMSIPAQNGLLKILEEPSNDTVFLLSTTSPQNVLPTIGSRAQKLEVLPIGLNETLAYWQDKSSSRDAVESAWRLSGGSVGLLHALLTENNDHPLKMAVDDAKLFLRASKYQRLLQADQLSRNKDNFQLFLDALSRTLSVLNHHAVRAHKNAQSNNLLTSRKILNESIEALHANSNSRVIALRLVLSIKI